MNFKKEFLEHLIRSLDAVPAGDREHVLANFAMGFIASALGTGPTRQSFLAIEVSGQTISERIRDDIETMMGLSPVGSPNPEEKPS